MSQEIKNVIIVGVSLTHDPTPPSSLTLPRQGEI